MKSLKNLQKFNEEFPQTRMTRVMTLPPQRGENKGVGPRRMSGLLKASRRHSKPEVNAESTREGTPPTTEREIPSVTSEEAGEVPKDVCEEVCVGGAGFYIDSLVIEYACNTLGGPGHSYSILAFICPSIAFLFVSTSRQSSICLLLSAVTVLPVPSALTVEQMPRETTPSLVRCCSVWSTAQVNCWSVWLERGTLQPQTREALPTPT